MMVRMRPIVFRPLKALIIVGIFALAPVQVVLAAICPLLDQVRDGVVFGGRALRWVDVIVGALTLACGVALAGTVIAATYPVGHLGVTGSIGLVAAACAGAALLMIVMRALLVRAMGLQAEMDQVI